VKNLKEQNEIEAKQEEVSEYIIVNVRIITEDT